MDQHLIGRLAAVVLGAVFVVAGAAKLADGAAWPSRAAAMGVPRQVARLVPWWELVLGALLVVGAGRPWPALAAAATLLAFTAAIVRLLATGRRPVCACFGVWSARPLGGRHVVRNAVLLALAAVALAAT